MNKNQVKGAVKEVAGKVQANAGQIVGRTNHQVKGLFREAEGKMDAEKRRRCGITSKFD